jgi:hypothetical protein
MNRHHFISYSSADAQDFALRLCDMLAQGPPPIPVWRDKREISAAIKAYKAARAVNKDAGVVARVLRLFDALAVVDSVGVVKDVRAAAAGE